MKTYKSFLSAMLLLIFIFSPPLVTAEEKTPKIPIKVVVVAMFDTGAATASGTGEFTRWVQRTPLEEKLDFKVTGQELRLNRDKGVLGVVTGIGTIKATATIMALGLDERFDLSKAYWVIAGIAGIDPDEGSVGSAVWAEWVLDGDLAHQIDGREIPENWSTGYVPLRRDAPYEGPTPPSAEGYLFQLNPELTEWAYQLTKDVTLVDNENMQKLRALYTEHPNAQRPPFVLKGDQLAAMTYWHGEKMTDWANKWFSYWTEDKGNFVTSAMEDSGTLYSLSNLARIGKVDMNRVLVLRTASNYSMQYPGASAEQSLNGTDLPPEVSGAGFQPSLEAAYLVGSKVVNTLLEDWDRFEKTPPGEH